jgi:dipeptidase D
MSQEIRATEPVALWNHFADLNAVPRASKKEAKIVAFMVAFGEKLGLEIVVDAIQNVILKKPATPGMENRKTVVLQSHLDMVHQKNDDTVFDFDTQGIQMEIVNGWIQAKGTTLGADNGIGVAAIMNLLSSTTIPHPAIEALFTVDEETGMTGAMELQPGYLSGEILLNLDTEDDDEISIGCAGGVDITAKKTYLETAIPENSSAYILSVKGLQGGHSGMDIHKGFGNANKIMNRLLFDGYENFGLSIATLKGGNLRNAIPREGSATIIINNTFRDAFEFEISNTIQILKKEFDVQETSLEITLSETLLPNSIVNFVTQKKLIRAIAATHNGVYAMNSKILDLVETSNNLARITVENGNIEIACLTRSFSESGKIDLANSLKSVFELAKFDVVISGDYPGWEPNPNTEIGKILKETYIQLFNEEPTIMACHAGLECGLLGTHYPKMEMISFGPTIRGAHSPEERVNIKSTQKFWVYLQEILKNIPLK